jgi:hypothetical protein
MRDWGDMAMTRRAALLSGGAAVLGASAAGLYGRLAVGDRFEGLVAERLGLDEAHATALLAALRARLGERAYDLRAGAFAVAVREPVASLLPAGAKREAIAGFVNPLLSPPPALIGFATDDRGRSERGCAALLRST